MVKYIIKALVEVDGPVDEHDIIGAIFGQTEGLLGDQFDLRELQDKNRIGRMIVKIQRRGNKVVGELLVPSNLDRAETALVAALLESVDRVGPYPAKIEVVSIIDVRKEKIKKIIERAKEILKQWREESVDIREILREISESTKKPEVIEYGPEKLPAGPGVDRSDTVIIVEGRADVINLLRYGYDNVIALGGAKPKIPETIKKLAEKKVAIAFVDGDRGGTMILKNLLAQANIAYVARAPPGKEVEDLTGKEIAKALSNLQPASKVKEELLKAEKMAKAEEAQLKQIMSSKGEAEMVEKTKEEQVQKKVEEKVGVEETPKEAEKEVVEEKKTKEEIEVAVKEVTEIKEAQKTQEVLPKEEKREVKEYVMFIPDKVFEKAKEISGTLRTIIYDSKWNEVADVPAIKAVETILNSNNVYAILHDGVATQRLLDAVSQKGGRLVLTKKVVRVYRRPKGVFVVLT